MQSRRIRLLPVKNSRLDLHTCLSATVLELVKELCSVKQWSLDLLDDRDMSKWDTLLPRLVPFHIQL